MPETRSTIPVGVASGVRISGAQSVANAKFLCWQSRMQREEPSDTRKI